MDKVLFKILTETIPDEQDKRKFLIGINNLYFFSIQSFVNYDE